jgi:hypothetical protein
MPNGVPESTAYEVLERHEVLDEFTSNDAVGDAIYELEHNVCSVCGVEVEPRNQPRHTEWHRHARVTMWLMGEWINETHNRLKEGR